MVVLVCRLVGFELRVDQVFLELDCSWGNCGHLLAEHNPVPALQPCENVSVVQLLWQQLIKRFWLVFFGPHRLFSCLLFWNYNLLFCLYSDQMFKRLQFRVIVLILLRILLPILFRVLNLKIHGDGSGALRVFYGNRLVLVLDGIRDEVIFRWVETDFRSVAREPFRQLFVARKREVVMGLEL